jgi:hypothetical protein
MFILIESPSRKMRLSPFPDTIVLKSDGSMVPLWLLSAVALFFFLCAGCVAKLRRLGKRKVSHDGTAAFAAAVASIVPGICCYAIGAQVADGTMSRNAGAACFVAFPAFSAVVLKIAARKRGLGPGSVVGAFLLSLVAVVLVSAWAILYLKGPRGGWTAAETLVFACSVVLIYSAAACLGWWCGRATRQPNA